MSDPILRVKDLTVAHDGVPALHAVGFDLAEKEILIVVGPSGCGKTTLLRTIAGLERPTKGSITLGGTVIDAEGVPVAPEKRPVGMVFQGLALFSHLDVKANIGFGLNRITKKERDERVEAELRSVGLQGLGHRFPHQLSGGQQQRVAIARSLVLRPRVLLMDEPFSDLDAHTRSAIRTEVLRILREHGTAAIIVSHDQEDAFHLGDRIAVMGAGRIERIGPADRTGEEWASHPFTP